MFDLTEDPILEHAAQRFVELAGTPPFFHQLPPREAREDLESLQSADDAIDEAAVIRTEISIKTESGTPIMFQLTIPADVTDKLPIVLYVHGGTWVLGSAKTHRRLVREIALGADVAVAFPDYNRAPEAMYPTALEQCWAVAAWLIEHGSDLGLDPAKLLVAGDCVGGNLAASLALLSSRRDGVSFAAQILLYPVTDTHFDSPSYDRFAEGFYVRRDSMIWGFDKYTTRDQFTEVLVAPLRASLSDLHNLPPAFVLTAEADVVRDEGEAYAARLMQAGVEVTSVRYSGTIHHFMMLDALRDSNASKAAIAQTISFIASTIRPRRRPRWTSIA